MKVSDTSTLKLNTSKTRENKENWIILEPKTSPHIIYRLASIFNNLFFYIQNYSNIYIIDKIWMGKTKIISKLCYMFDPSHIIVIYNAFMYDIFGQKLKLTFMFEERL